MIRSLAHGLRRRIERMIRPGGRGAVLLYHRVADEVSDPYGLCVTPELFEEHVQAIRRVGRPIPLDLFAAGVKDGSLPDRAIAITFDDGYIDNLERAAPILAKYDVPGLVFVASGPGGREREFWWDELERILLQPGELPPALELEIGKKVRKWELDPGREYTAEQQRRDRGWYIYDDTAPTRRHEVFREVYDLIRPLEVLERTRVLNTLLTWTGDEPTRIRPDRRTMTPEQVGSLVAGGIVAVGAHTVNHPALPSQPVDAVRHELRASKAAVEEWSGGAVSGFAYPYGQYNDTAVEAVREEGFAFACSGVYAPAAPGTDPLLIPRIEIGPVSGEELADTLRWQLR